MVLRVEGRKKGGKRGRNDDDNASMMLVLHTLYRLEVRDQLLIWMVADLDHQRFPDSRYIGRRLDIWRGMAAPYSRTV